MATKLGIRMIEKYEEMVRDDFTPLINQLESREDSIREEVTVIVKKEMGIYDDYVKKEIACNKLCLMNSLTHFETLMVNI